MLVNSACLPKDEKTTRECGHICERGLSNLLLYSEQFRSPENKMEADGCASQCGRQQVSQSKDSSNAVPPHSNSHGVGENLISPDNSALTVGERLAAILQSATQSSPQSTPRSLQLRVVDIFPAFGGVLCVALEGFPRGIVRLKEKIEVELQDALPPENLGSKWAKITIGAISSEAVAESSGLRSDSLEYWRRLREYLCLHRPTIRSCSVVLRELSVVRFANRALSEKTMDRRFHLGGWFGADSDCPFAIDEISAKKATSVTHDFFGDQTFERYVREGVLRGGPTTARHYFDGGAGETCVLPIDASLDENKDFFEMLNRLRSTIPLPGVWTWLPYSSMHCTVRGLT